MRKLTKKALSLVLCVMLVVSAFSCAFGVFAEEVGSTVVNGMTVYDAPVDLDFSGGLETWVGNTTAAGTPEYVAENSVLRANDGFTGGWKAVGPAPFKIADAVEGMGIEFSFTLAADTSGLSNADHLTHYNEGYNIIKVSYIQYNADGTVKASQIDLAYNKSTLGTKTSQAFRIDDPDEFFQIIFKSPGDPGKAWRISNISIAKTTPPPAVDPDEEYEFEFDVLENVPGYYGTADNGFTSVSTTSYPVRLKPAEAIANLDFEAGFVYWSGEDVQSAAVNTNVLPSDCFKLVPEGDNIYLDVKNAGYVSNIQTTFFDLSEKLQAGDTVVLIYDAMGEDATKIRPLLKQDGLRPVEYDEQTGLSTTLNPNGNGAIWNPSNGSTPTDIIGDAAAQTEFPLQVAENGWTTYMTTAATIFAPNTYNATASDGIYLQVKVAAAKGITAGTELDAQIDNIRIAKVVDGVYTDLATDEEIFDASSLPPSYYGTEKDGFSSQGASWPMGLKPVEGTKNLDFEQGFIYWCGEKYSAGKTNIYASSTFKLVDDGTNKYVTLKDEGYVETLRSALFRVEGVEVGDNLVLVYDAKGSDAEKIKVTLVQDHIREEEYVNYSPDTGFNTLTANNPSPGNPNTLVSTAATLSAITVDGTADGWTTYLTGFTAAVNDPTAFGGAKPCRPDIFLQIIVEKASGVSVGDQLDFALDNIRVAKIVDGVCVDPATDEVIYDPSTAPQGPASYYGTPASGFNSNQTSSYPLRLKPVEGVQNLDFSDGFVYWSGRNAGDGRGTVAADSFDLVTDGDNKYISVKEAGYVDTMRSALFRVENVEVGDHLVIVYDAKGADIDRLRMVLLQQHLRGEDNGVTYDEVTGLYDGSAGSATPGTPTYLVDVMAGRIALDELPAPEGWTTYVTDFNDAVIDPTTLGNARVCIEDIFLQVIVDRSNSVYAGDKLDAAIDNIRIAKVVDGLYYDIATGEPIAPVVEHPEAEVNADTLAWLVSLVMAGDTDPAADYNGDGNVDLLDIVVLKKRLTAIY